MTLTYADFLDETERHDKSKYRRNRVKMAALIASFSVGGVLLFGAASYVYSGAPGAMVLSNRYGIAVSTYEYKHLKDGATMTFAIDGKKYKAHMIWNRGDGVLVQSDGKPVPLAG
jgi:hypothetical protein